MTSISAQNILFDDFALLQKHIGRQELIATSVNTNCDCASSPALNADCDRTSYVSPVRNAISYPTTSHDDDRNPDQIAPFVGQAG